MRKYYVKHTAQCLHTEQRLNKWQVVLFILFLIQPTIYFPSEWLQVFKLASLARLPFKPFTAAKSESAAHPWTVVNSPSGKCHTLWSPGKWLGASPQVAHSSVSLCCLPALHLLHQSQLEPMGSFPHSADYPETSALSLTASSRNNWLPMLLGSGNWSLSVSGHLTNNSSTA